MLHMKTENTYRLLNIPSFHYMVAMAGGHDIKCVGMPGSAKIANICISCSDIAGNKIGH